MKKILNLTSIFTLLFLFSIIYFIVGIYHPFIRSELTDNLIFISIGISLFVLYLLSIIIFFTTKNHYAFSWLKLIIVSNLLGGLMGFGIIICLIITSKINRFE